MKEKLEIIKEKIKEVLGENLISMIVFGSVSRGDYCKKSDVDLIVVVKEKDEKTIEEINKIEDSISSLSRNFIDNFLRSIGVKKNIFLFSEEEFNRKCFYPFCNNRLLSKLLIPKGSIWKRIKNQGKVLIGKNLLEFDAKIGFWDKVKAPFPSIAACLLAFFVFFISRERAIELAQEGVKWAYLNMLEVLKRSEFSNILRNFIEVIKVCFLRK